MTSSFLLGLDTQAPSLDLEVLPGPEDSLVILKLQSDGSAVEAKLWGSIDPTDPANANYAETLGAAGWFSFAEELTIRVAPGGGEKKFSVKVRDDVWNESETETAKFGQPEEPQVAPAPSPGWPGAGKRKRPTEPRDESRTIRVSSQIQLSTEIEAEVLEPVAAESALALIARATARSRTSAESRLIIRSDRQAQVVAPLVSSLPVSAGVEISRRGGREDDEAALALLLGLVN